MSVKVLGLDCETYSEVPISYGTDVYAAACEIIVASYVVDDEEPVVLDLTNGDTLEELERLIGEAQYIVIHNSFFDRTVFRYHGIEIPTEKIVDTMVLALSHSLPGSLSKLSEIYGLGVDEAKDKDGRRLINLFCKPRPKKQKLRRATRETHPEDWAKFLHYAKMDIPAMMAMFRKLPRWNFTRDERELWLLDEEINDCGMYVDQHLARAALTAFDRNGDTLDAKALIMTEGAVTSLNQRDRVLDFLNRDPDRFQIDDLRKGTIADLLKNDELPEDIKELLRLRKEGASTSPTKYTALLRGASADGRLRGTTQFCGAGRTGRWGGRIFQPHNLPRPLMKNADIDIGIEAMKLGIDDLICEDPAKLCVSAIRGCIIAPPGKKFAIADLSNIEGRMLAWLAGEEWKLEAFRAYDNKTGPDLYVATYAKTFGTTIDAVLENEEHGDGSFRQLGKTVELAAGFGGSLGAFNTMGAIYGVNLPDTEVLEIIRAWRAAHPATTKLWYALQDAVWECVEHPDSNTPIWQVRGLQVDRRKGWLRIRLPSGRYLCYPHIRIERRRKVWTKILEDGSKVTEAEWRRTLVYDGVDPIRKTWGATETYYGKLIENVVQAASRDVLAHGMKLVSSIGADIVLTVHDEIIAEVPDTPEWIPARIEWAMSQNPDWAVGLPLAAKGFETHRYRKG